MPLADGRYGVCRVIRRMTDAEQKQQGAPCVLVTARPWIGDSAPDLDEPSLADILTLTHHSFKGTREIFWVSTPVPEGFRPLGTIGPFPSESGMKCNTSSGWGTLALQVFLQWRWDDEREAVLSEDAALKRATVAANVTAAADRRAFLESLTLEGLRAKRRFADWKGFVPDKAPAATRKIFRETIDAILEIGRPPDPRRVVKALRRCMESLNRLDEEHGGFIETIVREDLCEEFDQIVFASGFRNSPRASDRWRDW